MIKKILVAYDCSEESHSAFLFGLDMAKKFEAEIEVLSVVRVLEPPEEVETRDNLERGREHYEKFFKHLRQKANESNIHIKTEVALGHPAEQIIRWAEKNHINIIVMGHQTKNTFGRWLLGSTPDKVVHHAPCTVTIVKKNHYDKDNQP
jgi:nucleotide-binding universal stress UspA family protein